jgi:hypothetical protein
MLIGKSEGYRSLERHRHIWSGNIKMDHKEMGCADIHCIRLIQARVQWLLLVNNTEPSVSIKGREFLDKLRDCRLVERNLPIAFRSFIMWRKFEL